MTTLIIGAHGQIGQLLIKALVAEGETPRAMVRAEEQAKVVKDLGAEPAIADLEGNVQSAFEGCDKVVFTAGSGAKTGPDKTILVDMWGAMKAVDAAKAAGISQFVMVSSRGAEDPEKGPAKIKHYTVCKKLADDHLLRSGQPYTILRPGRLTDETAERTITTQWPDTADEQWIPREDVALAIAHCLKTPVTIGKVYPLFHGKHSFSDALN
ncbi:SDR family oxidoreductase [Marinimicrobium agarilyticum]|uniref:SDR family oxidoreductase n=1 Tax=Marinimicrobium agarilyticum TaxID=306546 RepID=UPI00040CAE1C|nr:SDR family oxidoreductase [Marinimicrobium agarilyticum]